MPGVCRLLFCEKVPRMSRWPLKLYDEKVVQAGPPVSWERLLDGVLEQKPTVVLVELGGGGDEAVAAIEKLMAQVPTPVLLMSPAGSDHKLAIRALAAGALDVVQRPEKPGNEFFNLLRAQLLTLERVAVRPTVRGRRREVATRPGLKPPFSLVAIAASLGGPRALAEVLEKLPKKFGAPVMICQHITAGFSDDLARWLNATTHRTVKPAVDGEQLVPGSVYVAGAGGHLMVDPDGRLRVDDAAPVGGFKPSCDVMLKSAASSFGEKAIGVVLTGMGRDGARGLKEIRARGGHTIAQDQGSSVVFGMPGEAIALGAAEKILPLESISAQLAEWVTP